MIVTTARRPVPRREDFPYWTTDMVRYRDLDRQNHVNNAVYSTYFETGRVLVLRDPELGLILPSTDYALVRAEINFYAEMHWPASLDIGTVISRVGSSSLTMTQAVFLGDKCTASADNTVVLLDAKTRRPQRFPDDVAARIRASMSRVSVRA